MTPTPAYLDGLSALEELISRAEADPLAWVRWMRKQEEFLRLDVPAKIMRAGNQAIGKTTSGLAEVRFDCLWSHPYRPTVQKPRQWIICSLNQAQSLSTQAKFFDMLPDGCLAKECEFNVKTGFGANKPMTIFANGSTVKWVTDDQGPRAVAGATVDGVLIDEPCSFEMYRELRKRLMIKRGRLVVTLTPINGPTKHFRDDVTSGALVEVHAPLTVDNCRYADTGEMRTLEDGTPCDEAWIASIWAQTPPAWADIVNNGGWEMAPEGVFFRCFDPKRHVQPLRMDPTQGIIRWVLGIDYAAADRDYGQVACLSQVQTYTDERGRGAERVYLTDHVVMNGIATSEAFAAEIVQMLTRHGLRWTDMSAVYGDNPVEARASFIQKSNLRTAIAIARELGVSKNALTPKVLNAKDGQAALGSKDNGCRYLYEGIAAGRIFLHPRCEVMKKALTEWDYGNSHPMKDVIDAWRYSLKDYVFRRGSRPHVTLRAA